MGKNKSIRLKVGQVWRGSNGDLLITSLRDGICDYKFTWARAKIVKLYKGETKQHIFNWIQDTKAKIINTNVNKIWSELNK